MLLVGDLNIAAAQQDVHDKLDREQMYPTAEKELFASLLTELTDVWRKLHPDTMTAFTVWDERTNARAFNEVIQFPCTHAHVCMQSERGKADEGDLPKAWHRYV